MTPDAFIAKWRQAALKERSGSQERFLDLCRLHANLHAVSEKMGYLVDREFSLTVGLDAFHHAARPGVSKVLFKS